MIAINPVFSSFILKIVAVAQREYHLPERFQIGRFLFGYQFPIDHLVMGSSKLYGMFYTNGDENQFFGVTSEIQVFLVIIGSCGICFIDIP